MSRSGTLALETQQPPNQGDNADGPPMRRDLKMNAFFRSSLRTPPALCAAAAALLIMAFPAHATDWVVCDYNVETIRNDRLKHELTVRLLQDRSKRPAGCPEPSGEMTFVPETADYQKELPRKQWPAPGQRTLLRYRYLDGICKSNEPCRIQHHSIIRHP